MSTQSRTGPPPAPDPVRKARRDTSDTVVGGVASGVAGHLAVPVLPVRIGFVVLAGLGGLGIALYAGLWLVLPPDSRFPDEAPGLAGATRTGKRPGARRTLDDVGPLVALAVLALGVVFAAEAVLGSGAVFWPIVLGLGGVVLLWRQADEAQRERWLDSSGRVDPFRAVFGSGGWSAYVRTAAGLLLVLAALTLFALGGRSAGGARDVLVAGLLGIAGLAIVVGPWLFRLAGDLASERAERVRSQEREDIAAHLHDSVLQTLALIQRNAGDATTVVRLARAQERDLRAWLYVGDSRDESTVASSLRAAAAEVEDDHGIVVDVVVVGDRPSGDWSRPVVLAAREAMVNAAKHAGTGRVDVYAEIDEQQVELFVRDRGRGFDLAAVAADRYGVRRSIIDRMERHGGTAGIRSGPGEGTEVRLRMPTVHEEEAQR